MRSWPSWAPAAAALVLLAALGGALHPGFLSPQVALDLLADQAVVGAAAVGMAAVLIAGGIDLSVGSLMALASVVFARAVTDLGWHPLAAAPLTLAGGALAGGLMGLLIEALALPAFLVTLAGLFLLRGAALALAEESLGVAHPAFDAWTRWSLPLAGGRVRASAVVLLVLVALAVLALRQARTLRDAYALGGEAQAARLAGVRVLRTRVAVHALSGACAALAGLLFVTASASGSSIAGAGLELDAIAAAVVGGVALTGGRGGALGVLLGVAVFGLIQNLILFDGALDAAWARVAMGVLLLAFLGLQRLLERR